MTERKTMVMMTNAMMVSLMESLKGFMIGARARPKGVQDTIKKVVWTFIFNRPSEIRQVKKPPRFRSGFQTKP
jgi:hypothetical protein